MSGPQEALPALAAELAAVQVQHDRADRKASVLLTPAEVAISVLAAGHHSVLAAVAAAAWAVCGALALAVVTPRLRPTPTGLTAYASATAEQVLGLLAAAGEADHAAALVAMSRLAVAKYRLIQAATATAAAALLLTAVALLGAVAS